MKKPTLFLVPTPLGNLKDITLRALEVLREVDLVVCEDTRHTRKLLTHYGISKPMVSCERFSEARKSEYVLEQLEEGKKIALVSDAGTPAVSDPGFRVICQARGRNISIVALPGPSALITAFSASGFTSPFRFIGFFPRKKETMETEIQKMCITDEVTIFYESPRRLIRTLRMIHARIPEREVCIARELTKIHEEYMAGTIVEVLERLDGASVKGEVTVLIKGAKEGDSFQATSLEGMASKLLEDGHSLKDILMLLSRETGIKRNEIYRMLLDVKKNLK
ncbi:MAG TPA: 16S rRNA (cytidine(1402)-2'-O)-methyltransferase [Deltaproteobacteria bacterium]|nr:16S rRNA (cytidine(1402)-2'-O)-methyltransferase [Deltaproteobacteria bacterium]HPR55277.1 16S rRNA (cytidine(1402)-2'-O)-methyltransferase [Deltaproteobacteria bacterium]HXK46914.1 16S rRNA (cytidine(1402)-2'-O)-methyltransferase [Deltaproteobacteria bacterium]